MLKERFMHFFRLLKLRVVFLLISVLPTVGETASFTWTGSTSSDMTNAANWTGAGGPPGPGNTAFFSTGATSTTPTLANGISMTIGIYSFLNPSQTYTFLIQGNMSTDAQGIIHTSGASSPTFTIANTSGATAAQFNFLNSSTAQDDATGGFNALYNINAGVGSQGSQMTFHNSSTAGVATISCQGESGGVPSTLSFIDSSTMGTATIDVLSDGLNFGKLSVQNAADLQNASITLRGGSHVINTSTSSSGSPTVALRSSLLPVGNANLSLQQSNSFGSLASDIGCTLTFDTGASTLTIGSSNISTMMNGSFVNGTGSGSLVKIGTGTIVLGSTGNNYTGTTTITGGTILLSGGLLPSTTSVTVNASLDISNASGFSQTIGDLSGTGSVTLGTSTLITGGSNASTTYSGSFTGTGTLTKEGSGRFELTGNSPGYSGSVVVNAGNLALNTTMASPFQINNGGTLSGVGTTTGDVINSGNVSPGNSIGTLTMGSYEATNGSITSIEVTATSGVSSEIITTNAVPDAIKLDSVSTLALTFDPGVYSLGATYTLLSATNGGTRTGTFTNVTGSLPGFTIFIDYTSNSVLLVLQQGLPSTFVATGNAGAVANALNQLLPTATGDLLNVINSLLLLSSNPAELTAALDQLQPSIFKGLALSQENAMIRVKDPILYRMHQYYWVDCIRDCCACGKPDIWAIGIGDYLEQKRIQGQNGFHTLTGGAVAGIDFGCYKGIFFGTAFGYTHTRVRWSASQAKGDIDSYYSSLYSGYFNDIFYLDAAVIAAYNHYEASRKLVSSAFNRVANNTHHGFELDGTAEIGFLITRCPIELRPFDRFDYIYLWEDDFTEHGANSLDLHVNSAASTMFRNEIGLGFAKCIILACWKFVPEFKASWIYERRFQGRHYTSAFVGTTVPFVVSGMKPIRSLGSVGFGVSGYHFQDDLLWSFYWDSEYGSHYMDQNVAVEVSYRF